MDMNPSLILDTAERARTADGATSAANLLPTYLTSPPNIGVCSPLLWPIPRPLPMLLLQNRVSATAADTILG